MTDQHTIESPAVESADADLILWGAQKIGQEIGLTERAAKRLLELGKIPANKINRRWISTRSRVRSIAT